MPRVESVIAVATLFLASSYVVAGTQTSAPAADAPPVYTAPPVQRFAAKTLRVYEAPEANQGVGADRTHFYAVDNTVIAKYELSTGKRVERWMGPRNGLIRHMNSCLAEASTLLCTNSNYAETPMASSIESFDTASLRHVDSHSLGLTEEGSLTWFDRYRDGWIAGFAHYDGGGGVPYKGSVFSSVVTFDTSWRRTGGWLLPKTVIERMAPYAASGGALGPDGWLYLLGHDRPEMYVVGRPAMGPTLVHLATIDLEAEGQAFSWAQDGSRNVFTIDRRKRLVRRIELPGIGSTVSEARPFR